MMMLLLPPERELCCNAHCEFSQQNSSEINQDSGELSPMPRNGIMAGPALPIFRHDMMWGTRPSRQVMLRKFSRVV